MEQIKSLLETPSSKLQKPGSGNTSIVTSSAISVPKARERGLDYFNPDLDENRWEVNYAAKEKFYLTDEEHRFFLEQIKNGAEIIQVGQLTLTKRFLFILPLKNKPRPQPEYEEVIDKDGNKTMRIKP